jgi:hypothetical protein
MLLAAAPQVLDHPIDVIVHSLPWWFFMVVHIALFVVGAYFALRAFDSGQSLFGWGFALFALAEISYMTYHVNITTFLFAHTIAEVLDGLAFVALFAGAAQKGLVSSSGRQPAGAGR